jgi:hypothetical protein
MRGGADAVPRASADDRHHRSKRMKQIKARRLNQPAPSLLSARDLMLAGLGVVAIARRNGLKTLSTLDARRRKLSERVQLELGAVGSRIGEVVDSARTRIESAAEPVYARVEGVLARFGKAKRAPAKRSSSRRTSAKPAARKAARCG